MPKPSYSFEIFPPKTESAENSLWENFAKLKSTTPEFVSVTYGAGGSTKEKTLETIIKLKQRTGFTTAGHITCLNTPRLTVNDQLRSYYDAGVRKIVALRGDRQDGAPAVVDQYESSIDLIAYIKSTYPDSEIYVSAYPEKHPESPSFEAEIDFLKRKIDAGASAAITQFFFNCDHFESYMERVRSSRVDIPIIPGILPITNIQQTQNFCKKTGTVIPQKLIDIFLNIQDENDKVIFSSLFVLKQIEDLKRLGCDKFHFYTMNKSTVQQICSIIDF